MYRVTQLPPTLAIKDSETRQFADALINVLDLRSGNTDKNSPERFLTAGDLTDAVNVANGVRASGSPGAPAIAAIRNLQNSIRESLVTQILETPFELVDLNPIRARIDQALATAEAKIAVTQTGITQVSQDLTTATQSLTYQLDAAVSRIGTVEAGLITEAQTRATEDAATTATLAAAISRIGVAEAAIVSEAQTRATADTATTEQLTAAISRIGVSESAISAEQTTRSNKDNALAAAINTIWAQVGGSSAVIQDGSLAAVTPAAVQASKWLQVQAAVTDPNTGEVSSTSIKQDLTSYASKVDGALNSMYSVRAQITQDGKTVVGGFGLSAVAGAGSDGGPLFDFAVAADRFAVVSPTGNRSALVWAGGALCVYDENGAVRVRIGRLL